MKSDQDSQETAKLPVTAELGDEGGSYGDATLQAETFKGAFGNRRIDPQQAAAAGGEAAAIASQGEQLRESDDEVTPATELPGRNKSGNPGKAT